MKTVYIKEASTEEVADFILGAIEQYFGTFSMVSSYKSRIVDSYIVHMTARSIPENYSIDICIIVYFLNPATLITYSARRLYVIDPWGEFIEMNRAPDHIVASILRLYENKLLPEICRHFNGAVFDLDKILKEGNKMKLVFTKLSNLLASKGKDVEYLRKELGYQVADLIFIGGYINSSMICDICKLLECQPGDIMECCADDAPQYDASWDIGEATEGADVSHILEYLNFIVHNKFATCETKLDETLGVITVSHRHCGGNEKLAINKNENSVTINAQFDSLNKYPKGSLADKGVQDNFYAYEHEIIPRVRDRFCTKIV